MTQMSPGKGIGFINVQRRLIFFYQIRGPCLVTIIYIMFLILE